MGSSDAAGRSEASRGQHPSPSSGQDNKSRATEGRNGAGLRENSKHTEVRLVGRARQIPPKLYRIGELAEYSGVSRQTIHNYTAMGLLTESRWTEGGHRLYDESIFRRLDRIAELRAEQKSLQFIRAYFARLDQRENSSDIPGPAARGAPAAEH